MTSATVPVVELTQARVARGERVLLDVPALAVRRGEILVVIGPNGAGKSTLLRVLGLLEEPAGGGVRFQGERVTRSDALAVRRRMASAFQEPLLADTTVADNAAMGLRFRGVSAAEAAPRVTRWLERLGVGALAHRQARTLSGGEAQRVALARALVSIPRFCSSTSPSRPSTSRRAKRSSRTSAPSFARIASLPCSSPTIAGRPSPWATAWG